jgi:hypothetical protein
MLITNAKYPNRKAISAFEDEMIGIARRLIGFDTGVAIETFRRKYDLLSTKYVSSKFDDCVRVGYITVSKG